MQVVHRKSAKNFSRLTFGIYGIGKSNLFDEIDKTYSGRLNIGKCHMHAQIYVATYARILLVD